MKRTGFLRMILLICLVFGLIVSDGVTGGSVLRVSAATLGDLFGDILGDEYPEEASGEESKTDGNKKDSGKQESKSSKKSKKNKKKEEKKTSDSAGQKDLKSEGSDQSSKKDDTVLVDEDGEYTSKEEVAAYLHEYGHLPDNFITKKEAKELGWDSYAGNLAQVAPGKSIGGDRFGNYEGQLPEKKGRNYYECDIDFDGGRRGAKRIIYSDDGLIFYTEDHYETFEQLYG